MINTRAGHLNDSQQRGFTLLELMVVVMIIAVLAAIAIPSYQEYVRRAAASNAAQEMLKLSQELERYKARNFNYHGFDPKSLYGQTTAMTSTNLPVGASGGAVKYTLTWVDVSTSTTTNLLASSSGLGQHWAINAIPSNAKYDAFLITSTGLRCKKKFYTSNDLTEINAYSGCGNNDESW